MTRHTMITVAASLAFAVALAATPTRAQVRAAAPAPQAAPRVVSLAGVIAKLNTEIRAEWKKTGHWPRTQSNIATDMNWALPNDQIIQGLTRKLSNNQAIDAYIKWQLLSFGPDFAQADQETLNRILAMIPDTIQQPEPKIDLKQAARSNAGGLSMSFGASNVSALRDTTPVVGDGVALQKPHVGVINQGTSLDTGGTVDLDALVVTANMRLDNARASLRDINEAVFVYRRDLRERFPVEGGWQIAMLIHDVSDRIAAGDPTFVDATKALVAAAEAHGKDPTISTGYRRKLLGWIDELEKYRRPVVDKVYLDNGRIMQANHVVAMDQRDIKIIREALQSGFGATTPAPAAEPAPAPTPVPAASPEQPATPAADAAPAKSDTRIPR